MKNIIHYSIILGILIALTMYHSQVLAGTYYVAKSGNDANSGSEIAPWLSIQKAATTLNAGDTVYIKAGTYNEQVDVKNSGTAGNPITFSGYAADVVTIDGTGISLTDEGLLTVLNKSYIRITRLQIINAGPGDNDCGILVSNSDHITIDNNYTTNTTSSGIGVWQSNDIVVDGNEVSAACKNGEQECITIATTYNFEIKNNEVHHNGDGSIGGEGIDVKDGSHNGSIHHNHVHHLNNRPGIYVDSWDKYTHHIDVYANVVHDIAGADGFTLAAEEGGLLQYVNIFNNIAYNNYYNGISISNAGDAASHPVEDCTIINNTFYNNGSADWGGGIHNENPDAKNIIIRNNICSNNRHYQIILEEIGQNITIDHNLIHSFVGEVSGEVTGIDFVTGDPKFKNTATADFHITPGSPAEDNGSSTGAPANDYEGNIRPKRNGYDIGAYELTMSPMSPFSGIMFLLLSDQ